MVVTGWVNIVEIKEIASDPDVQSVFAVNNFDELSRLSAILKQMLCDGKILISLLLNFSIIIILKICGIII